MIGEIFRLILIEPMINLLVVLSNLLFGSFGLAIIAFTILVRLLVFPLTLRQLHHTKALQQLQPRIQEINKKYSDPKRRQEEMMKVYREAGANPIGCLGPMLIQMPILFALVIAVRRTLPESPEALELLHNYLYSWSHIQNAVPVQDHFLGMDLKATGGASGLAGYLMVVLVGVTSWIQTRTTVTQSTDERARQQQQMMQIMMPLMFAWFALTFPNGVSLYWVVSSVIGIGQNILIYGLPMFGLEPLVNIRPKATSPPSDPSPPSSRGEAGAPTPTARELRTANGPGRNKRQNRRRRP